MGNCGEPSTETATRNSKIFTELSTPKPDHHMLYLAILVADQVSEQVKTLYADSYVKSRKGIFGYMHGGSTDTKNCQMLCKTHNRAKGNK
jgi:hypothetical protein